MDGPRDVGGRGSTTPEAHAGADRQSCGKIFVEKLVPGAPEIAHPVDTEKYERQICFIYAWFFEMWERIRVDGANPGQPGHQARVELQTLLFNTIGQVLGVAEKSNAGVAKKWAGELLAIIGVSLGKYDKHSDKLKENTDYAEMKKKLSGKALTSALFPTYVCGIAQQELETAEEHRERLLLLRECGNDWPSDARWQGIPEEYWVAMELREFSVNSESQWLEFLCPLIEKKIDVSKLPPFKVRPYDEEPTSYNCRTGKTSLGGAKKNRKRYRSDSSETVRDHLRVLARLRDAGLLH
jgi:hypothetical protein